MELNKIEVVTDYKHLQIREITDDEHQDIKDKAEELWTDEVKSAWTTFQAEQEAQRNPE